MDRGLAMPSRADRILFELGERLYVYVRYLGRSSRRSTRSISSSHHDAR